MSNNKAMKSLLNLDASPISKISSVSRFSQTIIVKDVKTIYMLAQFPTKLFKGAKYTKAKDDIIPSSDNFASWCVLVPGRPMS
jgi:hypothetical protein